MKKKSPCEKKNQTKKRVWKMSSSVADDFVTVSFYLTGPNGGHWSHYIHAMRSGSLLSMFFEELSDAPAFKNWEDCTLFVGSHKILPSYMITENVTIRVIAPRANKSSLVASSSKRTNWKKIYEDNCVEVARLKAEISRLEACLIPVTVTARLTSDGRK